MRDNRFLRAYAILANALLTIGLLSAAFAEGWVLALVFALLPVLIIFVILPTTRGRCPQWIVHAVVVLNVLLSGGAAVSVFNIAFGHQGARYGDSRDYLVLLALAVLFSTPVVTLLVLDVKRSFWPPAQLTSLVVLATAGALLLPEFSGYLFPTGRGDLYHHADALNKRVNAQALVTASALLLWLAFIVVGVIRARRNRSKVPPPNKPLQPDRAAPGR